MICYKCKIELSDINWYPSHIEEHRNICKKCYYLSKKSYRLNNRLKMNGKQIPVKKRKLKGFCEICSSDIMESNHYWHHWDDDHPELGMWLCTKCHRLAESLEYDPTEELKARYLKLKEEIIRG